jgi:hypothetical protein
MKVTKEDLTVSRNYHAHLNEDIMEHLKIKNERVN